MVSFDRDHRVETGDRWCTPFDHYGFTASAFAVEATTNTSVLIIIRVGNAGPGDFSDFITRYNSVSTRTVFTHDMEIRSVTVEVESCMVYAEVKRSAQVRALTISMFVINWVLTLCSVVIAMNLVVKGKVKDGVSILPITIILSIPVIQALYVGSPPFGIYLGTHRNHTQY